MWTHVTVSRNNKDPNMNRRILTLASALMLASSSLALAQTVSPPAPQNPPAATAPSGQATWYSHQAAEMRASKLIGTKVVNAANETVGDINEIVLGKDGKVAAVIIGVGGFLGIGEREVAVSFNSLQMRRDQNNDLALTVNTTKDALKSAPAWRWEDIAKR
jgi:sporulation protein YlmC with PRC-barrel domain